MYHTGIVNVVVSSDADMLLYGVPIIAFWDPQKEKGYYYPKDTLYEVRDMSVSLQEFFI